jgi:mannose-6-phosphate isomerase-like protein (cupin superfamily)
MIKAVRIDERISGLTALTNRGEHTTEADVEAAFATLGVGDFRDAGVFLGTFDGNAGWERHLKGDELVHVLAGATEFDIIVDDERQTLDLSAGMLMVVPQGCWHRFRSPDGVTVLTATPRHDEEHTFVDDPRQL